MEIIAAIIIVLIIVDIYYRIRNHARHLDFLLLSNDVINKALTNKRVINKKELSKARREVLDNLKITNPERYGEAKKHLLEIGIDIEG